MDLENWIPTMIASGALAFIWFDIRSFKKTMLAEMLTFRSDMASKKKRLEDEFMTIANHTLICDNRELRVSGRIDLLEQSVASGFESVAAGLKRLEEIVVENKCNVNHKDRDGSDNQNCPVREQF